MINAKDTKSSGVCPLSAREAKPVTLLRERARSHDKFKSETTEFKTGIVLSKTMDRLGERVRAGKIHHKIGSFTMGDIELQEFVVEVYSPEPSEADSPVAYLDGVVTSGMLEGLKVTFDQNFSKMIVTK